MGHTGERELQLHGRQKIFHLRGFARYVDALNVHHVGHGGRVLRQSGDARQALERAHPAPFEHGMEQIQADDGSEPTGAGDRIRPNLGLIGAVDTGGGSGRGVRIPVVKALDSGRGSSRHSLKAQLVGCRRAGYRTVHRHLAVLVIHAGNARGRKSRGQGGVVRRDELAAPQPARSERRIERVHGVTRNGCLRGCLRKRRRSVREERAIQEIRKSGDRLPHDLLERALDRLLGAGGCFLLQLRNLKRLPQGNRAR